MTIPTITPSPTIAAASPPIVDADALVAEIERYLADQAPAVPPPPRTAHPLVTKTTAELVAEAIGHTAAPAGEPAITPPGRIARFIPNPILRIPGVRRLNGGIRHITVEQHLHLTAHLISRGWTQHTYRSNSGRMCIQGAQRLLHALGYGDDHTANQAAHRLQTTLTARGIDQPYPNWNDTPGRTLSEVLHLIHTAAATT